MSPGGHRDGQWSCMPCHEIFKTWEALMQHKASKRKSEAKDHLHCKFCGIDFQTVLAEELHVRQEQKLDCPGCGHGPFSRVAGLMAHIEGGECARVNIAALEELREKKLAFPRRLQALTKESVKNDYTSFVSPSQYSDWPSDWRDAHVAEPFTSQEDDFPPLSAVKDAKTAQQNDDASGSERPNAWQRNEQLFPGAKPAKSTTAQELKAVTGPSVRMLHQALDLDGPGHPGFNAARYYSDIIEQFLCPKTRCGKTFNKANGLIGHLRSPAHGDRTYRCPSCFKSFKSLTAITSHAESSMSKCAIRETNNYGAYLDQLTAGMVTVVERHADGTPKYKTAESARAAFGNQTKEESAPPGW